MAQRTDQAPRTLDSLIWYYHPSDRKFLERAEVFAQRARDLPLDVYVRNPKARDNDYRPSELCRFLDAKSTRIRAFTWASPSTVNDFECMYFEAFRRMLDPEVLEEFTITDHGTYVPDYIYAADLNPCMRSNDCSRAR